MAIENNTTTYTPDFNKQSAEDKAKDLKTRTMQAGREIASEVGDKVKKAGHQAAEKTDSMLSSVGSGMSTLANTIRQNAPSDGKIGTAADTVAKGLETSGDYLSHHGVEDIAGELTSVVRKYPVTSLWVGVGVGVLLGSVMSRSKN